MIGDFVAAAEFYDRAFNIVKVRSEIEKKRRKHDIYLHYLS
jgi:hypothetical protein